MIKPQYELGKDITEKQARELLEECKCGFPPVSGGETKLVCGIIIRIRMRTEVWVWIADYDAQTEWEINTDTGEMWHKGMSEGCYWVKLD